MTTIKRLKDPNAYEITLVVNATMIRWLEAAVHRTMLGCTPEQVATHLLIFAAEERTAKQP